MKQVITAFFAAALLVLGVSAFKKKSRHGGEAHAGHKHAALGHAGHKHHVKVGKKSKPGARLFFTSVPQPGQRAWCPVMGHTFTVKKDTQTYKYKGRYYAFCCPACTPKFKANPDKYLRKWQKSDARARVSFSKPPAVGSKAQCPVTGNVFAVQKNTLRSTYKGRHHAFCCDGGKPKFDGNPKKFLKRQG